MSHSKKIALFISHIYGDYQKNVCQGVIDKALEYGYQTEVYATSDGEDVGRYGLGEASILRIPNFSEIQGVIIASDTYPEVTLKESIFDYVKKNSDCPIVEITDYDSNYPAVSLENNHTCGTLTEHLIAEHGYKHICYLGCSTEDIHSSWRELAYRGALAKRGLHAEPKDIYQSDYSLASILEAIDQFTEHGTSKPDAIVCYNDHMALLLMVELIRKGYRVPEDIAITGCDVLPEGQNIDPCLTSVTFPVYELGLAAMDQMLHILRNEEHHPRVFVHAKPWIGSSCGCHGKPAENPIFYGHELTERIRRLEAATFTTIRISADFSHVSSIEDAMDLLEERVQKIQGCSEFYLCLYSDWDAVAKPILELTGAEDTELDQDSLSLEFALRDGKRLPTCTFSKNSILPDYINKASNSAYIITPLYFEDRAFGYIAMAYENNKINFRFHLMQWIMSITSLLHNLCEAKGAQLMQEKLVDIYMRDSLTGLLNRHGYDQRMSELFAEITRKDTITAFMVDMDRLKQINDEFGHHEGDFALKVFGQAIHQYARPDMICTRFGGDEFSIIAKNCSKKDADLLIDQVSKYLANYNQVNNKPYELSASFGYATASCESVKDLHDLESLMAQADALMYEAKNAKKAARD